jgi:hypothetical protein
VSQILLSCTSPGVRPYISPRRRKEIYKYLEKLYYDLSNTGAYIGPSNFIVVVVPDFVVVVPEFVPDFVVFIPDCVAPEFVVPDCEKESNTVKGAR